MKSKNFGIIISTEFIIPAPDRGLSVHVITCNTVWQIPKSRCPCILSACAAHREVCSHEERGRHRYPTPATLPLRLPDWFWRPKKSSFNDIVHLSHWLKVGGWVQWGLWEGGWLGLVVGTRGEGYYWGQRGEDWGYGTDRWKKKIPSHLTNLLSPSMGPRVWAE